MSGVLNIMGKLIMLLRKRISITTFIITVLLCVSYFSYLQNYNPKWINDYVKVVYLLPVLVIYFCGFSIIFLLRKYTQLMFKVIFKHLSIILLPLVACFAAMISYGFCLTAFNFQSIFISIVNFWQYSFIMLVIVVSPSIIFSQICSIIKLIKPAAIQDMY